MTTFEERQAKRKAAKERELEGYATQDAIAAHFAPHIRDQINHIHMHERGPSITFEVETLADALPILATIEPVTYYYLTGGTFGHVNPREWIKPRDWEGAKEEMEFCAPYIEAASGPGYTKCKVKAFALIYNAPGVSPDGKQLVKISIEIRKPPANAVPFMAPELNVLGHKTGRYKKQVHGLGECKIVNWSSGSPDAARVTRHWHELELWKQFCDRVTKPALEEFKS